MRVHATQSSSEYNDGVIIERSCAREALKEHEAAGYANWLVQSWCEYAVPETELVLSRPRRQDICFYHLQPSTNVC